MKNEKIKSWEKKYPDWRIITRRKYRFMLFCTIIIFLMLISIIGVSVVYAAIPVEIQQKVFVVVVEHRLDPQQFDEIKNYINTFKDG